MKLIFALLIIAINNSREEGLIIKLELGLKRVSYFIDTLITYFIYYL